jgi:hypothetical protein
MLADPETVVPPLVVVPLALTPADVDGVPVTAWACTLGKVKSAASAMAIVDERNMMNSLKNFGLSKRRTKVIPNERKSLKAIATVCNESA